MSSRLFKHQMAALNRPPIVYPHFLAANGQLYSVAKNDVFTPIATLGLDQGQIPKIILPPTGGFLYIPGVDYPFFIRTGPATFNRQLPAGWSRASYFAGAFANSGTIFFNGAGEWWRMDRFGMYYMNPTPYNPGNGGFVRSMIVTPDDKYIIYAADASPKLTVWRINADTLQLVNTPADPVGGNVGAVEMVFLTATDFALFFPDGTPAKLYRINPITGETVLIGNVPGSVSTNVVNTSITKDRRYLAVATATGFDLYRNDSGTLTKLSGDPSVTTACRSVSFWTDTRYLAVGTASNPVLRLYKMSGEGLVLMNGSADTGLPYLTSSPSNFGGVFLAPIQP